MAIDGALRKKLAPGTRLVAKYKGAEHAVEVLAGDDGKLRFRLADGREFGSPSAAGSAVMGGIACNGCPCGMELHKRTRTRCGSSPSCGSCP